MCHNGSADLRPQIRFLIFTKILSFWKREYQKFEGLRINPPPPGHTEGRNVPQDFGPPQAGICGSGPRPDGKGTYEQIRRKKVKAVFGGKGFYIALALCLLAAGIVGYYTLLRPQAPAEPASNPASNVPDDRDNAWVAPAVQPEENVPAAPPAEETPISDPQDLLPQVMSPLDGTTVTVFSVTELMYDETMADWRTHNGIDIQASEGDSVRTAASGTVLSVKDDELMGTTVVIQHGGGYTTQYSCLQKDPPVQEGDQVAAGDVIGLVGSTASAEGSMGPHLHFSVSKDGQVIDPADYVN